MEAKHTRRTRVAILIIFLYLCTYKNATVPGSSDCLRQRCGDLVLSYPFALSDRQDCPVFSSFFQLHCDLSTHKLFFNNISTINNTIIPLQVNHITPTSLVVDSNPLRAVLAPPLPNSTSCGERRTSSFQLPSFPGPFYLSDGNYFGSFGCTLAVLITANLVPAKNSSNSTGDAENGNDFADVDVGGCSVSCPKDRINPECGHHTCCVTSLALKKTVRYAFYSVIESPIEDDNATCSPAGSSFSGLFHPHYTDFDNQYYGLEINWALPYNRRDNAIHNPERECSPNSNITIVNGVPGYRCFCKKGYTGDGYSKGLGCKDVDECAQWNDCVTGSTCHNTEGSYVCACNARFHVGDGRKTGSGCQLSNSIKHALAISGGIMGFLLVVGSYVCLAIWWRERTKRKYFLKNGGFELQALLGSRAGREVARIFTEQELKSATQNYAEHMKIGTGGFGTVFKGILQDGRIVAVKKAKNTAKKGGVDSKQFFNEMAILTQINHRHIVRLLGFCLETAVPLLVYEYVSHGNVSENLHLQSKEGVVVMGWWQRLNVARQTAEALAYLHAAASPPILHRDVKSANVLLDNNFDAKVADFGTSRLVPEGVEQVETAAQGTIGYLDPEYFQTLQLTDKSDVYSLGVMLLELITGLKPIDTRNRESRFASLVLLFIHHMQDDKLDELIDARLHHNPNMGTTQRTHASIMSVAGLARRCLALAGSMRPSMSQVADELRYISQTLQAGDDEYDDVAGPSLFAKRMSVDYDVQVGAVVAHEGEFHVLQSSSIDDLLRNAASWPR